MASRLMKIGRWLPIPIKLLLLGPSCTHSIPEQTPPPRVPNVVLVHGIFGKSQHFKMLQKHLEQKGFVCYAPELVPNNGHGGLEIPAAQLKKDIEHRFGSSAPIHLVSFSMGGLVSREYLQHLGGAKRCENFITISTPHHGTFMAWFVPSRGAQQMRIGSPFLAELEKSEGSLQKMRITSYRTPLDLVIIPASSSVWSLAENRTEYALLHPWMLRSSRLIRDVEQRLRK
jgi:triacylglycerol lipase